MPDRVSALRLRPASCLLCGMQTVTCLMPTARIQGDTGAASACCCMGVASQILIVMMSRTLNCCCSSVNSACSTGRRSHLHSIELQGPQRLPGSSGQRDVDLTGKLLQGLGVTIRQHNLHG